MTEVELDVNGVIHRVNVTPAGSLYDAIRSVGLTGTKAACREGECGSCTVLLDGTAVCSCLVPAATCDGRSVVTVEGIDAPDLSRELVARAAVQCGFCTPGIVVAAASLLDAWTAFGRRPPRVEIAAALSGNLCRCTGYGGIIDAVEHVLDGRLRRAP